MLIAINNVNLMALSLLFVLIFFGRHVAAVAFFRDAVIKQDPAVRKKHLIFHLQTCSFVKKKN